MRLSPRYCLGYGLVAALILVTAAAYSFKDEAQVPSPASAPQTSALLHDLKPPRVDDVFRGEVEAGSPPVGVEGDDAADAGASDVEAEIAALSATRGYPGAKGGDVPGNGENLPFLLASNRNHDGFEEAAMEREADPMTPKDADVLGPGNPNNPQDITISTVTIVPKGNYYYRFVNIVDKGALNFQDATIDFWVKSILVENGGTLRVGTTNKPIGTDDKDNVVTFHLYGSDQDTDALPCSSKNCGVPDKAWVKGTDQKKYTFDWPRNKPIVDWFDAYETLPTDEGYCSNTQKTDDKCYFGRKVIGVSYGGSLFMFGRKGATYGKPSAGTYPSASYSSWARLDADAKGKSPLRLDRVVDWQAGDEIVVTTTDYLPSHSELHIIKSITTSGDGKSSIITTYAPLDYPHNGERFDLTQYEGTPKNPGIERLGLKRKHVETRAAVALLSRNIRIVSAGAKVNKPLPGAFSASTDRYYGGHVMARQGFKYFQMQGVELSQMGQGGRMAHNPVTFHLTRTVPPNTFVNDCSIWDSMTHWIELRGTQGVDLMRNVGYLSIGHGYHLADGTETDNWLVSNIGITARPAVDYVDNPRTVPGVVAAVRSDPPVRDPKALLEHSGDYVHPSVFLIMNGYNNFLGNMAVGAGTCGACYWFAPGAASGFSQDKNWDGYAGLQADFNGGKAPIKAFKGNFCSTAPYSLMTIGTTGGGACRSVVTTEGDVPTGTPFKPIKNPFTASYLRTNKMPRIDANGQLAANTADTYTQLVNGQPKTYYYRNCNKTSTSHCLVNWIDTYTTSFHWAQQNYSAIWLRTNWFLVTDSAITDVLNGGLTMVSGGSYDQVINKYWALTQRTVFIGNTQDGNPFASNAGPVNPDSPLSCKTDSRQPDLFQQYCRLVDEDGNDVEGFAFHTDNFSVYQRLYNIYDGPVYQESNAYLKIHPTKITTGCTNGKCQGNWLYSNRGGSNGGIIKSKDNPDAGCILPNAAIGWKQPNGFYYPPAFHSANLFFKDVDIRHFVIVPLFNPGTRAVDDDKVKAQYCTYPKNPGDLFTSFTDIDRQTELNDDDGTLSGLSGAYPPQFPEDSPSTVSVNTDSFFYAPRQILECVSEKTCIQSPYDFITLVAYPDCAVNASHSCQYRDQWDQNCDGPTCSGVQIYRQFLNQYWNPKRAAFDKEPKLDPKTQASPQLIKMMGAQTSQRSSLIVNRGTYYINTTANQNWFNKNIFQENESYYFFLLYAKETTVETLQLYVGKGLDFEQDKDNLVQMVRVGTNMHKVQNDPYDDATVLVIPLRFKTVDDWPSNWHRDYDSDSGILTVTMDLTGSDLLDTFQGGKEEACGPVSFCKWDGKKCVSAKDGKDDSICKWSVKASECPSGGCFGIKVTFPAGFEANGEDHRPEPKWVTTLPLAGNHWRVDWETADVNTAGTGACYYPDQPEDYNPFANP